MKSLIKQLLFYDKLYPIIKSSFFYQARKKANGQIADFLYGHPSKNFFVIGVTGTNGKTTTVNLIHKILNDNVGKTMSISTANIRIGNEELKNKKKMTSLDIYDLQSTLAIAKEAWCKIAVLEVSSHGLEQYRFEGVSFDAGVLTNITHDHLDYHGNMENYAKAKKKLFTYIINNHKKNKIGVFNADDSRWRSRFDNIALDKKLSYSSMGSAFLQASDIKESRENTQFTCSYLGKKYAITTPLLGTFNVSNILAAIGVVLEMGVNIESILPSIETFAGVEGRMQSIEKNGIQAFVDFAHTPDGLEKTLTYLASIKNTGKLITTFGATGVRDKEKRPIMGEIAANYSDIVILTDDDPDTENRLHIIDEIQKGITKKTLGKDLFIIPERTLAIQFATQIAQANDILIFAGKGHETIQYTNFRKRPRSDVEEVKKYM